jgi:hypothetical protein
MANQIASHTEAARGLAPHLDALIKKILPAPKKITRRNAAEDIDVEDYATLPRVVHERQKPRHRCSPPTMVPSRRERRGVGVG